MGQSDKTEIIEFNGLAGCGKTTLARDLKKELIRQGYRAVLFGEACHIFKQHPVNNLIRSFNMRLFFQYIRFFLVIGRRKENTLFSYWAAIRISIIYRWCLKTGEFDFILCDHGLIQNTISLLGFSELKDCEKINQSLALIIKAESRINMVNCNVRPELASKRIRSRNRNSGRGRLDAISNNLDLNKLLLITEINFSIVRNIANIVRNEWPITELETDIPTQINVQKLINLLTTQRNIKNEL